MEKREYQEIRTKNTYRKIRTVYGSFWVLVQADGRAYIESADRVIECHAGCQVPIPSGSPIQIKNIDYSMSGHLSRVNGQWKFLTSSWAFSCQTSGGGLTNRREMMVRSIIEQSMNDWERICPDEAARAFHEAELIGINNAIESVQNELEAAEKVFNAAQDKLVALEQKESDLKRNVLVAPLTQLDR